MSSHIPASGAEPQADQPGAKQPGSKLNLPATAAGSIGPGGGVRALEPMDPQLKSIQPGGGQCMRLELAWGMFRRFILRTVFPGYVRRMQACRQGQDANYPHPILDPRDLKFYQNRNGYYWLPQDDPFRWRDHLPFARAGLAELMLLGGTAAGLAIWTGLAGWWWLSIAPAIVAVLIFWFFRNPRRVAPPGEHLILSPADGKIVQILELDHHPFIQGPAVQIGIFLSIFNVHINRVPMASRIIGMTYRKGKFLNALLPRSAQENEQLEVRMEQSAPPFRGLVVRQIAGAIARRIVCWVKPGDQLLSGAQFGLIKFGSRTELVFPREAGTVILCRLGQNVQAGTTILAEYSSAPVSPSSATMSG